MKAIKMSYSDLGPRSSLGKTATATAFMMRVQLGVCSQLSPVDGATDPEFLAALHSQCVRNNPCIPNITILNQVFEKKKQVQTSSTLLFWITNI